MDNIINNLRSFIDDQSLATQFIACLTSHQLRQLSQEITARVGFNKQYPGMTVNDALLIEFLLRMQQIVNRLIAIDMQNRQYPNGVEVWHSTSVEKLNDYEAVYLRHDHGWETALRVDKEYGYFYNLNNLRMIVFAYGHISIITAPDILRFWSLVIETQCEFETTQPIYA